VSTAQVVEKETEILPPQAAQRVLISLMFSSMLMPMVSGMSRVALPVIRDDFGIPADLTAWVLAAFMLPFVILMPVYGRLSDGVDRRLLILAGIVIFGIGSTMTFLAPSMSWLMAGRAIQGIGVGGMTPMGMALLASIFSPRERGRVMGTWSAVGPAMSFVSSFAAGILVAVWGWRGAFVPGLLLSVVAFVVIYRGVPTQAKERASDFLRQFDWGGVALLSGAIMCLMFYLSSRSVTGVAPFEDWRLLLGCILFLGIFLWWEKGRENAFVALEFFGNGPFCRSTFCASMRMFVQGAIGVLMPLYFVDVHQVDPAKLGVLLVISSAAMTLIVRFGGRMSDRFSCRWLVMIGLFTQLSVMMIFSQLPETVSVWVIAIILAYYGLGAGLMLAALHSTVMGTIEEDHMGAAAGLYSMLRFMGMAISTALVGVVLQFFIDAGLPTIDAYQRVFLVFTAFPVLGLVVGFGLQETKRI
jgi:MFS family permease